MLTICLFVVFAANAQDTTRVLRLPKGKVTLQQGFDCAKTQLGLSFCFPPNSFDTLQTFRSYGDMTLGAFYALLKKRGLDYQLFPNSPNTISVKTLPKTSKPQKEKTQKPNLHKEINLEVSDEQGNPLPNVTVENIETPQKMQTDTNGHLFMTTNTGHLDLRLTYVGRETIRTFLHKEGEVKIILSPRPRPLDEVFVDGYAAGTPRTTTSDRDKISGAHLFTISTGTPQTVLEGQVAGLLVTQTSGIPGGSVYLTIRGQSSILNGSDALYVVDGIPFAPGNQSLNNISSANSAASLSPFSFINMGDIESIEVLKDADATAIYGSRGANGVILITTKKWKGSQPKLDFQYSSGFSEVSRRPALMNTTQYLALRNEAFQNDSITATPGNAQDLFYLPANRSTDWGRWLIGAHAHTNELQLSLSGGHPRDNYLVGLNSSREADVFPTQPEHSLINTFFNANHRNHDGRFELHISGMFAWDQNHQFLTPDPTELQFAAPNAPQPIDSTGNLVWSVHGLGYLNPWSILGQPYHASSYNFLTSAAIDYWLYSFLSFKGIIGANQVQTKEFADDPVKFQQPSPFDTTGTYMAKTQYTSTNIEPQIDFHDTIGRLRLNFLGGVSWQTQTDTMHSLTLGVPIAGFPPTIDSQSMRNRYTAYFARFYGIWKDKYVLDLTGRRDGTNRFHPKEQFGNFGAVGAAWIFSGEKLIQNDLPWLSFGKLRATYGITGNDQIGDHAVQTWSPLAVQPFHVISGFYSKSQIQGGPAWEKIRKQEVSLDLGFLGDRFLFNVTWYQHRSSNMLIANQTAPAGSPAVFQSEPVILENKGWEFTLFAKAIEQKHFGWTISLNWSLPQSKLISFPGLSTSIYTNSLFQGKSINSEPGYVYTGVNPQTGLYQFQSQDHNTSTPAYSNRKVNGKLDVTSFGGVDNMLRWRHFQLDMLVDARVQTGVNYLAALFTYHPPGSTVFGLTSNAPRSLENRWRNPGDIASFEKATTSGNTAAGNALTLYTQSSALLTKASFVRMRKLSLSYQLPPKIAGRFHLSSASFFVNAQNLFTITPYKDVDPEIQSALTLPTLRTVETGIHLSL